MRKPLIVLALIASTFAVPAIAFAAAPTVEKSTIQFADPEAVFGSCDGFDMLSPEVLIERTIITWYDANGEPVREQRQAGLSSGRWRSEIGPVSLKGLTGAVELHAAHRSSGSA